MFHSAFAGSASRFGFQADSQGEVGGRGWHTLPHGRSDQRSAGPGRDCDDDADRTYDRRHHRYYGGRSTISRDDDDLFEKGVPRDHSDDADGAMILRDRDSGGEVGLLSHVAEAKTGQVNGGRDDAVRVSVAKEVDEDPDCKTGRSTLYYQRYLPPS